MKIRLSVLAIIIPFILNCGGASGDISTVKNGTYGADRSVTVGNALDGYKFFTKKEWKSLSDPQKRRIIEFTGTLDVPAIVKLELEKLGKGNNISLYENLSNIMNKTNECSYYAQFVISADGKSFSLYKSGIRYVLKNGQIHNGEPWTESNALDLLSSIYKNEYFGCRSELFYEAPESLRLNG